MHCNQSLGMLVFPTVLFTTRVLGNLGVNGPKDGVGSENDQNTGYG